MSEALEKAKQLDAHDPLAKFRGQFLIPQHLGEDAIYLSGNSLGLQPCSTRDAINSELDDWALLGVKGHEHARFPWLPAHEFVAEALAEIVGAKSTEVVAMNGLTVNLHLMLVSFYRPTHKRCKVVIEKGAFPSDRYAVCSHIEWHGFSVDDTLIEIAPRAGEVLIRDEDIATLIETHGNEIALIMLGGVNYYSGQLFDMAAITKMGHEQGCKVGFDLAHVVGNVPTRLHDWGVDFAVWCNYKYLNSGPGSIAASFIHEVHCKDKSVPRLNGWWGHDKSSRFAMPSEFKQIETAEAWQLSNPPILQLAALRASLEIFGQTSMRALREKSVQLTGFLYDLLSVIPGVNILTSADPDKRGCQLSIQIEALQSSQVQTLDERGVICDYREPEVIRVAPVPMYNSYMDVYRFSEIVKGL